MKKRSAAMVAILFAGCFAGLGASAREAKIPKYAIEIWNGLQGPASASIFRYAQARTIQCFLPGGAEAQCSLASRVESVRAFYSEGASLAGDDVLAVIVYAPVTGNAVVSDTLLFHRNGQDYRLVKAVSGLVGDPVAARFSEGGIVVSTRTMRPEDARCCASGRTDWTLDPARGRASWRAGYRDPRWR